MVPCTTRHFEVGFDALTFDLEIRFEAGVGDSAWLPPGKLVYDETVNNVRYRDEPPHLPQLRLIRSATTGPNVRRNGIAVSVCWQF